MAILGGVKSYMWISTTWGVVSTLNPSVVQGSTVICILWISLFLSAHHSVPSPGQRKRAKPTLLSGEEPPLGEVWVAPLGRILRSQVLQQLGARKP